MRAMGGGAFPARRASASADAEVDLVRELLLFAGTVSGRDSHCQRRANVVGSRA